MSYLDERSYIPKHAQLKEIISEKIASGEFLHGDKLPGEQQLSKEYNISRGTVRRALSDLVNAGVVFSKRGKGTFVIRHQVSHTRPSIASPRAITLIAPDAPYDNYLCGRIFSGVEQAAQMNGYYVILACSNDSIDWERHILEDLIQRNFVEGFIIIPSIQDYSAGHEHIAELCKNRIPFILVDRFFRDLPTDYAVTDNEQGAYRAVTHLIRMGHRKIGYVMRSESVGTSIEDRFRGYTKALADHDIPFDPSLVVRLNEEGNELNRLLYQKEAVSAFFCIHDRVALRVLSILREGGKKVPEDIAVVGYDDLDILEKLKIGLTTMHQPLYEEGKMALVKLLKRIRGEIGPEEPQQVVLCSTLVVRQSCGSSKDGTVEMMNVMP